MAPETTPARLRRALAPALVALGLAASGLALAAAPAIAATSAATAALGQANGEALAKINEYFNGIRTMGGDFVQFGPTGERTEGTFVIARPGRVRFEYDPPSRLDIVADGKSVVVRDTRRNTQDVWPLDKTPLRFLLADQIDLVRDAKVTDVSMDGDLMQVTIQESTVFGEGRLTLTFDATTTELKQWTVTDAQGLDTTVAIYNLKTGIKADPKMFEVDYLQSIQRNR